MKILTIDILPDYESLVLAKKNDKEVKYPAVKLTVTDWFFWTKEINAYPVLDQEYDSLSYVNDLGKEYHWELAEQICNYVTLKHIQKKL